MSDRAASDFYIDQPEAIEALLRVERFSGVSLDPACGTGNIPKGMASAGLVCRRSDIVDRNSGLGFIERNFLDDAGEIEPVDNVVCNPPFNVAREFVTKALDVARHKVAMLLPLTFLEGQRKAAWLQSTPLARVHVFTWRINMPPGELFMAGKVELGGGKKCFAWFVWEHGWRGPAAINLLIKPDAKAEA